MEQFVQSTTILGTKALGADAVSFILSRPSSEASSLPTLKDSADDADVDRTLAIEFSLYIILNMHAYAGLCSYLPILRYIKQLFINICSFPNQTNCIFI